MNYPVWDVAGIGSGLVVAIIAIIHVFISHLAVGGGAFLLVAEWWASRQPEATRVRDWLHQYASWFLVFTTVAGATTGVGIWFAIQLANPEATSLLIHQFVFAWAVEWVFFLLELTVLYLYYYGWKTNGPSLQLGLASLYFATAWGSLFVINGILTFMLTPGNWSLETHRVLDGFFNPGFFPSLLTRTVVMLLLGGLLGVLISARMSEEDPLKDRLVKFSLGFVVPAALLLPGLLYWYWTILPPLAVELTKAGVVGVDGGTLTALTRMALLAGAASAAVILGSLLVGLSTKAVSPTAAIALLLIAQLGILGGEFYREMARKPYVLHSILYSNGLWKHLEGDDQLMARPYLETARWSDRHEATSLEDGEAIFRLQCASCHTRSGYRSLASRTRSFTPVSTVRWLKETMHVSGVMPPFQGDLKDRAALTAWILSLNGQKLTPAQVLEAFLKDQQERAAKSTEVAP